MNSIPLAMKWALNILFYIFYTLVVSVIFSFLFPIVLQLLGREILNPNDPVFVKIQLFIALLVLIISLILRRYFYLATGQEKEIIGEEEISVESYSVTKKTPVKKKNKKQEEVNVENDEDIKIYVEKEIK